MKIRVAGAALLVALVAAWLVVPRLAALRRGEDVPPPYAGKSNPRAGDPAAIEVGAALFQENCATCHGAQADGRGPAAVGLSPSPANFSGSDVLARHSDAYLFFRVSEGKPGTAMPSFHGSLADDERWAVIAYLRTLPDADHGRALSSNAQH